MAMQIYNEIDPYAAQWLRNLGAETVITKSIEEVQAHEVENANRFHAFAGIGLWEHALRLAGWPTSIPVWTGSCPCQPFSVAGKGEGEDDPRHLWPEWKKLIKKCIPPVIFGEQVASPAGRNWLDSVSADLEALGYAVGAADLCAAGVGAPHIRQRLFFVAYLPGERWHGSQDPAQQAGGRSSQDSRTASELAHSDRERCEGVSVHLRERGQIAEVPETAGGSAAGELGHPNHDGSGRDPRAIPRAETESGQEGQETRCVVDGFQFAGATRGFWADADWLACTDGKARPVEPGTFPLVNGGSNRVGKLRAYGNAISPQVAEVFIRSVMETLAKPISIRNTNASASDGGGV